VWDIITDFDNYSEWNPFIKEISGNQIVGKQIEVLIKPLNSNEMRFRPKILVYKPEEELRWMGKLWIPKLFDGEHSLIIKKIAENKVLFIQKEKFRGLLIPLFQGLLKNTESGFKIMNQALKSLAENRVNKGL